MSGLTDYLNSMIAAMKQRKLNRATRIGRGQYQTPQLTRDGFPIRKPGDYTGQQIRAMNAQHGVGRPIREGAILVGSVPTGTMGKDVADTITYYDPQQDQVVTKERLLVGGNSCGKTMTGPVLTNQPPMTTALNIFGSQRKAAQALGLNLSTFQRRLLKETSVA